MPTCRTCAAKDAEIQRLTDQVGRLLEAVCHIANPPHPVAQMSEQNGRFEPLIEDALSAELAGMPPDVVRNARKKVATMLRQQATADEVIAVIRRGETVPPPFDIEAF